MSALPDFAVLRPLFLLALPLLAAAAWWWHRHRAAAGAWQRAATPALLQAMAALGWVPARSGRPHFRLAMAAAALTALALTGPAAERRDAQSFRNLDGVILVIDASPSVAGDPRWPQMQTMAQVAVASLGTRPAGAVVYAGDAYLAGGMTMDHAELGQTLTLIDAETVPDPGSRPERGLRMALQVMEQGALLSGDVLLLSDGAGLGSEALAVAGELAARNLRVSAVVPGTPSPDVAALARLGGGQVFATDQTAALAAWLGDAARTRLVRQAFPLLYWRDLGRAVLVLALLPVLMLFRRPAA
ncbi:VWA domain-containing protein [Mangrovicoccus sp. HB161399]|uniref:vWA domain-containing protein n=1 Tax=Mangrovicoccus sp. HB161399 TaxID=2720392 RepID=UPI00352F9179